MTSIAVLVLLILINGFFAMSEVALLTARRSLLAKKAESGDAKSALAMDMGANPTRFLSTLQIGITGISILIGIASDVLYLNPVAESLQSYGLSHEMSKFIVTATTVVILTAVTIVIGELVPKRLGQNHPEAVARGVARIITVLTWATRPFVRFLSFCTDSILRLLPGNQLRHAPGVTEEVIHAMLEEGSEAGVIEQQEHQMVRNVFRLDDRQIASLMIPRADIVHLDTKVSWQDNLNLVITSDHSRFPVCRGGLDDVVGIITTKQLLNLNLRGEQSGLTKNLQPAVFVPESLTGMELLEHFRASGTQMVLVVDEYGAVQGLVTLQDVLEAVTGEFTPTNKEDMWGLQRDDGTWLLDGLIPIPDLKDTLSLRAVPEEEKNRYHTLSGMLMLELGRLPRTGDQILWEDWRFEVLDMDGKRIDKVLATHMPPPLEDNPKEG